MVNLVKYDRQETVRKAAYLFWEKGFHATSMRNLQDQIDMHPGSIYAAFGSKEGLFREALQWYVNTSIERLSACVHSQASPLNALKQFVKEIALGFRQGAPSEMCMLVKTISELTEDNEALLMEAKRLFNVMEDGFADLLSQAQAQGELSSEKDVRRLARLLQMQLIGLRVYARANANDGRIVEMIDDAFISFR
jgi:AcrR family transcriptional regulator